ncbi:MAG: ABC transporter ATP-binding protein [Corynebacterium sp.]|nr:ABC transporter ATP-binding protein [Corynebacterium sp.]
MSEAKETQTSEKKSGMGTLTHDALAPASVKDTGAFLRALPSMPGKGWWAVFFITFSITIIAMTMTSTVLGRAVDVIGGRSVPLIGSGPQALVKIVIITTVCAVLEQAGRAFARFIVAERTRRLSVDLRRACLVSALRAPIPEIMKLGTGNVITRLTKDIDRAIRILNAIGVRLVIALLMFPFTMVTMLLVSPWYLLVFIGVFLILIPAAMRNVRTMPAATNKVSAAQARLNNQLLDTVRSMQTLRRLRIEKWAVGRLEETSWDSIQAEADRVPLVNTILRHGTYAYGLLVVGTLVASVILAHNDMITPGDGAAAMILVLRLEMAVFNLLYFAGDIQNGLTCCGRAVALARIAPKNAQHPSRPDLLDPPTVSVKNLSFSYPGGADIIRDLSVEFPAGTTTAIVGASGAGKSTLGGLIAGLQLANEGDISLETASGERLSYKDVSDTWWARQVTLISQEVHLFSGSLREDLNLARPGCADEEILGALAAVGLGENSTQWARWFPQGLDTQIGAGAEVLPPEVAQQISLARIILRNPQVLIMDEATSEAGSQTAHVLEEAAVAVAKGRTSIVVAHRLDQAMNADQILVMDNGSVVEAGTHQELIARGGRYAELFSRWV